MSWPVGAKPFSSRWFIQDKQQPHPLVLRTSIGCCLRKSPRGREQGERDGKSLGHASSWVRAFRLSFPAIPLPRFSFRSARASARRNSAAVSSAFVLSRFGKSVVREGISGAPIHEDFVVQVRTCRRASRSDAADSRLPPQRVGLVPCPPGTAFVDARVACHGVRTVGDFDHAAGILPASQ